MSLRKIRAVEECSIACGTRQSGNSHDRRGRRPYGGRVTIGERRGPGRNGESSTDMPGPRRAARDAVRRCPARYSACFYAFRVRHPSPSSLSLRVAAHVVTMTHAFVVVCEMAIESPVPPSSSLPRAERSRVQMRGERGYKVIVQAKRWWRAR